MEGSRTSRLKGPAALTTEAERGGPVSPDQRWDVIFGGFIQLS